MEAPSKLDFNLDQTFFGFKPKDRVTFHDNIFNLIWHGEGRWDWDTIYEMPIFLRRHWTKRINKIIEERTEYQNQVTEQRKRGKKSKTPTSPIGPPSFAKSKS
jgi:hypothetical protein